METKICKCCGRELDLQYFSKNRFGYTSVCKRCASDQRKKARQRQSDLRAKIDELQEQLDRIKTAKLDEFSPRDLMAHLASRGYKGTLVYTKEFSVDITTLDTNILRKK